MRLLVLFLFIAVPLVELAILIKVGEIIGAGATILLVIATAVIGVALLKRQGLAALAKAGAALEEGRFPVESAADGACLLVAGAFLLTPGLLTDTAGFLLLVPGVRHALARWLFDKLIKSGRVHVHGFPADGAPGGGTRGGAPRHDGAASGPVIEGEYEDMSTGERGPEPKSGRPPERKPSPWRK